MWGSARDRTHAPLGAIGAAAELPLAGGYWGKLSKLLKPAAVARSWGWSADQISIQRLMTHDEAAANCDGRVMHDNYGPHPGGCP